MSAPAARRAARAPVLAAGGLLAAACTAPQRVTRVGDCVPAAETTAVLDIVLGDTVSVRPPCPDARNAYFNGPLLLTATADGLRVRFRVYDSDVGGAAPRDGGSGDDDDAPHDVAVVYPAGESLGRSAIELAVAPNPPGQAPGYVVDDTLAWGTWGLTGPDGGFRLVCAIVDRESGGGTTEVREVLDIRVRSRR